jgi:hypothetical protein
MTMDTGFSRIEPTGLPGPSGRPEPTSAKFMPSGFVWLPVALIAGFGGWMLLSGYDSKRAESEPVTLAAAPATEPAPLPAPVTTVAQVGSAFNPAIAEAITPAQTAPVDGLKISSQSWRRGGLGSIALVTFTLSNGNNYGVKDIELFCSFARRDGSHLTDRTRRIPDIVNMKSRKTFARIHIGFINVNAERAKCAPIAANHI